MALQQTSANLTTQRLFLTRNFDGQEFMKYVMLYDPQTKQEQTIPVSELSPEVILASKEGGPIAWVDPIKLKRNYRPLHPPFSNDRRRLLVELKKTFDEVYPCSVEEWEFNFRCDQHPDREIRHWRWMAFQYKRLTNLETVSHAFKRDCFQLCLRWTLSKDAQSVLQSTPLQEMSRDTAAKLLSTFEAIPAEFFSGDIARSDPSAKVWDTSVIRSLGEFQAKAGQASIIFGVDWDTGNYQIACGIQVVREIAAGTRPRLVCVALFAIDFETDELECLLACVQRTKGWYEWNGKVHRGDSTDAREQ